MGSGDGASAVARSYDALAAAYDRRWARYVALSTALTLDALPPIGAGARVLDVGCGTGQLLAALAARSEPPTLAGVDVSREMLARAAARLGPSADLRCAPAEHLPFGDATFDLVVTASSLHYWREPARGFAEIARVLVRGGHLVVTDWCREGWRMRLMDRYLRLRDPAHHRALTRRDLATLAAAAGFTIGRHTSHPLGAVWRLQVLAARLEAASSG
jgi:ubiquinone/menaquinone biosynthesis C-methylase UbiE